MKLYNVVFKDGKGKTRYTRSGSMQSTGIKVEGVMTIEMAENRVQYYKDAKIIPYTDSIDGSDAVVKSYDLSDVKAIVIKRTNKYIWISQLKDNGEVALSTLQKYKVEHEGTYDFWTKSGYRMGA